MAEEPRSTLPSDEELARMAQCSDDAALALLISRYMPQVRLRSVRFAGNGIESEDLMQEGIIGLLTAIRRYQPEKAGFRTFAALCVDRSIISALRLLQQKRKIPPHSLVSLEDTSVSEPSSLKDDPLDILIANEDLHQLSRKIDEALTVFEREILSYYLAGFSYEATASQLKCSQKAVDNALQRIRRKLR